MIYKFYSPLKVELEDEDFGEFMELDNNSIIECYGPMPTQPFSFSNLLHLFIEKDKVVINI